ncbi:MAG: flavodoxin family protein [Pseudomonadota bacterium]
MKKILGIIGSPRKGGNCEIAIKEIGRNIPEPHELLLLRLDDFKILACRGCYGCLREGGQCVLKDDIHGILDAMCRADAIILAAPTYFLGANAGIKRFIDRAFSFYTHIDQMWGKPSLGICVAGIPGKEGHGLLGIENFLKIAMTDIKMTRVLYGALPGEIFLNEENRVTTTKMGMALFQPAPEPDTPRCPLCGSDTFRFLGGAGVRCMLCSNRGTMDTSSGAPVFAIEKSDHDFFLSKAEILKHRDWLVGMKNRFAELKPALKSVTLDYGKDGVWIKPAPPS